ncbi:sensor histidine kinase [Radicibacter daui]|uniref:sensor histidine kinase n=1 Tax=Radicibacter daui TaxID=3064829 RepID=UPI004046C38F
MFKAFRLPRQLILLTVGFVTLVVSSLVTVWLVQENRRQAEEVARTLDIENDINELKVIFRRAESTQRGFLLTEDDQYLAFFDRLLTALPRRTDELKAKLGDLPEHKAAFETLVPIVAAKVDEMRKTVELQQAGRHAEALAVVNTDAGLKLADQFTQITNNIRDIEQQRFEALSLKAQQTGYLLLFIGLSGSLLICALAGLSFYETRRNYRALAMAHDALAAMNAGLEERVKERTAELQEANEEIQRFAYIVSHDLRSPLVNIMGFTSELEALKGDLLAWAQETRGQPQGETAMVAAGETGELDPRGTSLARDFDDSLGFIKSAIAKMDRLINAILKLSRAGRREFRPEPIDLDETLRTILSAATHQIEEAGATVIAGALPKLTSDRLAIEQIFSNLVDNALKYMRAGVPGEVSIRSTQRSGYAIIEVADNGRGIAAKDRERIFELFRRSGVQDRPGEGIGLAHVRTLVRGLGGRISVDSELGKGSTFTVTLPLSWKGA